MDLYTLISNMRFLEHYGLEKRPNEPAAVCEQLEDHSHQNYEPRMKVG